GIKPASLAKVNDPEVKAFIEKCTAHVSERLPAKALLMDPFLQSNWDGESVGLSSRSRNQHSGDNFDNQSIEKSAKDNFVETSREFTVEGQRRDVNTIFLKLRIADSSGHIRNIHFPFDIGADTSFSVASEMVEELELTDQDVSTIAMTIDSEIRYHIPSWSPSETPDNNYYYQASGQTPETMLVASPMGNESPGSLALEILPSGRKYWSDSPKAFGANSPSLLHGASNLSYEVECDGTADSPFNKSITSDYLEATGGKFSQEKMSVSLTDFETEDINKIATKLETMLVMQREELDELKRKHKLAVSDFLNEFSSEVSLQVLNICNMQMPDSEM
ncbi:putative serine threonine-protein kinase WNK2-like protein, partial [Trifolium pratense]